MNITVAERLAAGLERKPNGCLEWGGSTDKDGYGEISVNGKTTKTHRLAWTLACGPIPDGLWVLHHCDNPPCCDTDVCLFLGTHDDNMADRSAKGRTPGLDTIHCPAGHAYTAANTYVYPKTGWRRCRRCRADGMARLFNTRRQVA